MPPNELPNKLSALLALSLDDLEMIEQDERYVVDMTVCFHAMGTKGQCRVCLAGAMLAHRFELPITTTIWTCVSLPSDVASEMLTINALRLGDVSGASHYMADIYAGPDDWEQYERFNRTITSYDINPNEFKRQLRELADDLAKAGH